MPDLENDNPIAQGAGAEGPPPAPSSHPLINSLEAQHDQAKAQFGKIGEVNKNFETVRRGLDSLVKLGDAITSDDVIEEIGKLVAQGLSPEPLIAMMAGDPQNGVPPMPESGQALAAWVQSHEQQFVQHERQLGQIHSMAQQRLGLSAAKVLVAHHIADKVRGGAGATPAPQPQAPPPQAPAPSPNPLTP